MAANDQEGYGMRPIPENRLDKRIIRVWRISALLNVAIWSVVFLGGVGTLWLVGTIQENSGLAAARAALGIAFIVLFAIAVLSTVLLVGIMPKLRHLRWRYQVNPEEIDILKGIIWRERIIVPLVRVQNVDTKQGPLMRANGLASFTVATAAGEHEIPGLAQEEADTLRDRVAYLARLAQEDV